MNYKIPRTVSVGGLGKTKRIEIGGTSPISIRLVFPKPPTDTVRGIL